MEQNFNARSAQQQRCFAKQAKNTDATQFFNLLTDSRLLEIVEAQLPEHRERQFPPTVTLAMFLNQVMSADGSCQNAVNGAIVARMLTGMHLGSTSTSGYCQARRRLPQEMVSTLARQIGVLLGEQTPTAWLWRGREVKLVDGTTVSMPDTTENQARFPQHGQQEPGVGFPLARLVGVIALSHGAVLDAKIGPYQGKGTGEHGLFRGLRECFVEGDVMLADSYFCSYFLIADMRQRGVDVLFEQHGARITDFRTGKRLGERDHLVCWFKPAKPDWMSAAQYHNYPNEVEVREVKVDKKVLVSTFLSPRKTPKAALEALYWQRWNVELDLRNIKTTLGMEVLRCKTPSMCEKEFWIYLLAYNLIRLLMAQAALQAEALPRQLSFKHTLQIWAAWNQRQFLSEPGEDTATLFILIAQVRVADRPGRVEPRAVKRRPKPYPRLNKPRRKARMEIEKRGHAKKLRA
jgi:hypothetical protein